MTEEWQAGADPNRFTTVVDAAVAGQPQFIRLKAYLLAAGCAADDEDAYDRALRTVRADGELIFGAREVDLTE